ncbi:MAG: clan AA aspartic protease (TIGR02281 family), partial [Psychrobacter glaciei]
KNKHYLLAENAINAFLAYAPDDLDFLRAVVKLRLAQQQILLAVKKALSLEYHTFNLELQQQSLNYAQALVRDEIKRLFELALWLELAQFTEEVLAMVPNSAQAQWALAQAQFQLGDYSFARQNLTALIEQPNYQVKAQRLFNTIELALQRPEMVPLIRNGDHFIVEGLINNNFSVDLLIDTGASISVLSQGVFDELVSQSKVKYIEDIVLTTAGGEVDSRIYQVEEFALQGYQVNNLLFAVIPYKGQKNDGLLGMNYLRLFDFHIDQSNNLLRLENKP